MGIITLNSQRHFFQNDLQAHSGAGSIRDRLKRLEILFNSACLSIFGFAVRRFPTSVLVLVLAPPALIKTTVEILVRKSTALCYSKLRKGLTSSIPMVGFPTLFWIRMRLNINRAMTFSGGQIRDSRWQARIEYRGLDALLNCVNSGQSVLLTSLHYGSPRDASIIIRSLGVRISSLAHGPLRPLEQNSWNTRVEQWGLQSVPYIFYPTDMWEIKDFLCEPGNAVLMLIETENGERNMSAAFIGGQIRTAKGFIKFAEMTNAVVLPFTCTSTGFLRWRLAFGNAMVYDGDACEPSTFLQQIMQQLEPEVSAHAAQIQPELIRALIRKDDADLHQQ